MASGRRDRLERSCRSALRPTVGQAVLELRRCPFAGSAAAAYGAPNFGSLDPARPRQALQVVYVPPFTAASTYDQRQTS